jgi:hypothetical protein
VHDAPLTCTGVGADDSEPLHPLREQGRAAQDRARCAPRCADCPPALGIIVIIAPLPWSQRLLDWLRHAQLPPPPPTTGALRDVLEIRAPPAQRGTVRVEPSVTVGHITRRLEPTHMLAVRAAACPSPSPPLLPPSPPTPPTSASRAFPAGKRSILTEIYLCHACSYHDIEDGSASCGARRSLWLGLALCSLCSAPLCRARACAVCSLVTKLLITRQPRPAGGRRSAWSSTTPRSAAWRWEWA